MTQILPVPVIYYNVKTYGAKGDGTTDDASAIAAAISAAGSAGGTIYFPPGTYNIKSPITITNSGVALVGSGVQASIIQPDAAFTGAAAIILTGANFCKIQDLSFIGISSTYSSNPACDAIQLNHAQNNAFENIFVNHWNGYAVECINDATGSCYFNSFVNVHARTTGAGFHFHGYATSSNLNSGSFLTNCNVENILNGDGIFIEDIHDLTISNLEGYTTSGGSCIHIKGESLAIFVQNIDIGGLVNGTTAEPNPIVLIESGTNGSPGGITFSSGIIEDGLTGVSITAGSEMVFKGLHFIKNGTHGMLVSGSTDNILVNSCVFDQNGFSTGTNYDIDATTTGRVIVSNCLFKTPSGTGVSQVTNAINFGSGGWAFNNAFRGATAFAGTPTVTRGNVGFNPVGHQTPPSVPASGTAQTNPFSSDSFVYVTGGTVTGISIGGSSTGLTSGTFFVGIGQTITLTYSAAPTWSWFGN